MDSLLNYQPHPNEQQLFFDILLSLDGQYAIEYCSDTSGCDLDCDQLWQQLLERDFPEFSYSITPKQDYISLYQIDRKIPVLCDSQEIQQVSLHIPLEALANLIILFVPTSYQFFLIRFIRDDGVLDGLILVNRNPISIQTLRPREIHRTRIIIVSEIPFISSEENNV